MLSAIEDVLLNEPIRLQPSPSRGQAARDAVEGWGEIDNMLKAQPFLELSLFGGGSSPTISHTVRSRDRSTTHRYGARDRFVAPNVEAAVGALRAITLR
jgi:hypothetical protein